MILPIGLPIKMNNLIKVGDTIVLRNFRWECPGCGINYQLHPENYLYEAISCGECDTEATITVFTRHNSQIRFNEIYRPIEKTLINLPVKETEFNVKEWLEN